MRKTTWATPKLEVLSTRKTAAGGQGDPDVFHSAPSGTDAQPSGKLPGVS